MPHAFAPAPASASPLVSAAFEDQWNELTDVPLEVTGRLPEDLVGTLYRNTPTGFHWPKGHYRHWFDGHGQIHAVRLDGEKARYTNRFVATKALARDRRQGGPGGAFGTPIPGGLLGVMGGQFTTMANTNVIRLGDRLLALQEGNHPVALSPDALETLGPSDLGFLGRSEGFSAHPHFDSERGVWLSASQSYRPGKMNQVRVASYTERGLGAAFTLKLPYAPMMVHDFGFTATRVVVPVFPLFTDLGQVITGRRTLGFDSEWRPERGAWLVVADRDGGRVRHVELPPMFAYHVANCHDDGDTLVVDLVTYDSGEVVKWTGDVPRLGFANPFLPRVERLRIWPDGRLERSSPLEAPLEFVVPHPVAAGARHRWLHAVGATRRDLRSEADVIWQAVRFHPETGAGSAWRAPAGHLLGEASPVPKAGRERDEDALWLLAVAYDPTTHRSRLVVLDGEDLASGPVAEAHFPQHMPPAVHGCFVAG